MFFTEGKSLKACSRGSRKAVFGSQQHSIGEQYPAGVTATEGSMNWRARACVSTCPGQSVDPQPGPEKVRVQLRQRAAEHCPEDLQTNPYAICICMRGPRAEAKVEESAGSAGSEHFWVSMTMRWKPAQPAPWDVQTSLGLMEI